MSDENSHFERYNRLRDLYEKRCSVREEKSWIREMEEIVSGLHELYKEGLVESIEGLPMPGTISSGYLEQMRLHEILSERYFPSIRDLNPDFFRFNSEEVIAEIRKEVLEKFGVDHNTGRIADREVFDANLKKWGILPGIEDLVKEVKGVLFFKTSK